MRNTPLSVHAFRDDAMGQHDAVGLAKRLRSKELSLKEVITACIERANQVEESIHAIEAERFEQALNHANYLPDGFFAGVPTFIKGNTPVKGFPTTHGSAAINARPEKEDGPYAKQYLAQGFTLMGKSTLPEFGFNATTEPEHDLPTRNPWNTDYSCGASSGGAAALVASGVVPIAHANDGGGSIRIPAACCGLIGLKPSRGRHINSKQARSLPINIVSEGVVTRSVRDTAYFHAQMETYYRNPKLPPIGLVTEPGKKRLRIGMVIDSITGYKTDTDTRRTVEATAGILEDLGHSIIPFELPIANSFMEDFILYWSMLAFLTHRGGKLIMDRSFDAERLDGLSIGLSNNFKRQFYKAPAFLYRLNKTYSDYAKIFDQFDLVLTPVLAHTTPKLGHISPSVPFEELIQRLAQYVGFTPLANASGAPAISIPMGLTQNNLPISVQFSANHGMEKQLLEIAYELEQTETWARVSQQETLFAGA